MCVEERTSNLVSKYNAAVTRATIDRSSYPKRYLDKDLANIVGKNDKQEAILKRCRTYVSKFGALEKQGSSLIFTGGPGCGKTMIALSMVPGIIRAINEKTDDQIIKDYEDQYTEISVIGQAACKYVNVYDLFSEIKATYNKSSLETEADVMSKYCNARLLILDEVGVQLGTDFEASILFRIINKRYENMKPTFIISNLAEKDLSDYIGQRTIDRFYENHGAVFVFDWESHRR